MLRRAEDTFWYYCTCQSFINIFLNNTVTDLDNILWFTKCGKKVVKNAAAVYKTWPLVTNSGRAFHLFFFYFVLQQFRAGGNSFLVSKVHQQKKKKYQVARGGLSEHRHFYMSIRLEIRTTKTYTFEVWKDTKFWSGIYSFVVSTYPNFNITYQVLDIDYSSQGSQLDPLL